MIPAAARELVLIGIGAGNPEWVTLEAVAAIREIDVLFVVLKGDELDDLVQARRTVVERHRTTPLPTVELRDPPRPWRTAPDYDAAVARWRVQRQELWGAAVAAKFITLRKSIRVIPLGIAMGVLVILRPGLDGFSMASLLALATIMRCRSLSTSSNS